MLYYDNGKLNFYNLEMHLLENSADYCKDPSV